MIGNREVENRYKNLVHLVLTLTSIGASSPTNQNIEDLRNYTKFVKFSLAALVVGDPLPESGSPDMPRIDRAPGDGVIWHPNPLPQGWDNEDALDEYDPHFRPRP